MRYWQVELDPQVHEKIMFTTPQRQCELPPSIFQRITQFCLGNIAYNLCWWHDHILPCGTPAISKELKGLIMFHSGVDRQDSRERNMVSPLGCEWGVVEVTVKGVIGNHWLWRESLVMKGIIGYPPPHISSGWAVCVFRDVQKLFIQLLHRHVYTLKV